MDFPVLGDADVFAALGKSCADLLMNTGDISSSCYDSIRPVGIVLIHALPFLMTNDIIEQNYITILFNMIFLCVLVKSILVLFRNFTGVSAGGQRWVEHIGEAAIVAVALVLCVAYVPVRLSDIQGFSLFMASVAVLSTENDRKNSAALVSAGLLAGIAVLMKQNYVVPIFFLVVFWFCFDFKDHVAGKFKHLFLYLSGTAVCLIQVAVVYSKAGVLWFYDPKAMEIFAPANAQPFVELIAYTDPVIGSYISQLQVELSSLQYIALKFYDGIMKFYWSVYLGKAPFEETPVVINITVAKLIVVQTFLFAAVLLTCATAFFKNKWMSIVSFMAMFSTLLSATLAHTENRYYLMIKIIFVLMSLVAVVNLSKTYLRRDKV